MKNTYIQITNALSPKESTAQSPSEVCHEARKDRRGCDGTILSHNHHHNHQSINVPTAGAQAFLMDHPQGERAITLHAGPARIGGR
jgi:hypothetical protein